MLKVLKWTAVIVVIAFVTIAVRAAAGNIVYLPVIIRDPTPTPTFTPTPTYNPNPHEYSGGHPHPHPHSNCSARCIYYRHRL